MPIPASQIVAITPRLITAGSSDLEFNGLLLTKNSIIPMSSMVLEFTTSDAVGSYFGLDSDEYNLAVQYFLGYSNSFAKPRRIMVAARVDEARAAYLRGAEYTGSLNDLKEVTEGSLSLTIDGADYAVASLDFSEATSFSGVAEVLQTALSEVLDGVTVEYSSLTGAFQITSPTTGADSTIDYASSDSEVDVATLMGLTKETGAILSQGSDALSINENMSAIKVETQNWVTFTTVYQAEEDEILSLSAWASGQGVDYLYVPWSDSVLLTQQGTNDNIADQIENAAYGATTLAYKNPETAVFVLAMLASIDWERWQGTITTAFKKADGLAATVTDETTADILLSRKVNFIGKYATRNSDFTFFYEGKMFGDYGYIDTYANAIWLKNVMQVSIMDGLTAAGRVPYNERGYTMIRAWLQDPINRAVKNGCIDIGMELSESQKAQIFNEAGLDITQELWQDGYYLQVEDAGASVRTNRESPNINVWYTYAGSVHHIEVASTQII